MILVSAPTRIDISPGWSDADPFRKEFGGSVLNAAINLRVSSKLHGKDLVSSLCDVPSNSGLGTSGAIRTTYLVASNTSLIKDKIDLIRRVNVFENAIVDQRAGFQDQAAAIFGGVNLWSFRKDGGILKKRISKKNVIRLQDRLVLVYTGDRHLSANVHELVFSRGNYLKHIDAIQKMSEIAVEMKNSLNNDLKMGELFMESWKLQKQLHKKMETKRMNEIFDFVRGLYLGGRATGAGGGGCLLFYTTQKRKLSHALKLAEKKFLGMKVIDFKIDFEGIKLVEK